MIQIQDVHACGTQGKIGKIQRKERYLFQVSNNRAIQQVVIIKGNLIV